MTRKVGVEKRFPAGGRRCSCEVGGAWRWKRRGNKSLESGSVGLEAAADVWRHVLAVLWSEGVYTCLRAHARLAGLTPDEIMDLSDRISENGGEK